MNRLDSIAEEMTTEEQDDLDPVYCHRCGEYCTEPRVEVGNEWLCPACAEPDQDYTGPVCSHCREPVSTANATQTPLYSGRWLCDACAAAAEHEWDRRREERD